MENKTGKTIYKLDNNIEGQLKGNINLKMNTIGAGAELLDDVINVKDQQELLGKNGSSLTYINNLNKKIAGTGFLSAIDSVKKQQEMLGNSSFTYFNNLNKQIAGTGFLSAIDSVKKQQEILGNSSFTYFKNLNKQIAGTGFLSAIDSVKKQQEMLGGNILSVFDTMNSKIAKNKDHFRNLTVPYTTATKIVKSNRGDTQRKANEILNGISPDKFKIRSEVTNNTVLTVLENTDNKQTVPLEDISSTVGVIDITKSISKNDLISFYLHLSKYPMLGLEHPVGNKIYSEIENIKTVTVNHISLFRVRPRDFEKRQLPFSPEEMFAAPYGTPGKGRYNVDGHGELYVCTDKKVAIMESLKNDYNTGDIIEWKLIHPTLVIDLTDDTSPLVQYCSFSKQTSKGLEYLVPNFIAQCAKMKDITGIRFNSSMKNSVSNYVLFDFEKRWFEFVNLESVKNIY